MPLDVGPNVITIEVTPADGTPTHTYTVTVTRAPNTPPAFNEGLTTTRGVDENTPADTNIGDSSRATDDDNDTLTYSLDATSAASFDIVEFSGQLRTKADLDHETKSSYTVTVSVRDSMDANGDADEMTDDTIRVTIQVANLNEAPEFPQSETGHAQRGREHAGGREHRRSRRGHRRRQRHPDLLPGRQQTRLFQH